MTNITYDAKGQREAIWYGDETKTAYTYDPNTFRLTRLLTAKSSTKYQDLNYYYDAVGNVTRIYDSAMQCPWALHGKTYANAHVFSLRFKGWMQ